uniref:Eukaryotic translation initiation factor 4 gamma 3 n=1 Tax=Gasterosteus aculeatus aculeatus TaxID=481459 RepID=A0AAQ4RDT0_GASAC
MSSFPARLRASSLFPQYPGSFTGVSGSLQQQAAPAVVPVPRHAGPPYTAHDLSKGHPNLAGTPPGHAHSPALSQVSLPTASPYRYPKGWEAGGGSPYNPGQNAASAPLVYSPQTQPMNAQPQSRPFATGPRPTHHQFFQRTQMQTARPTMATNTPSLRPGSQTPTAAVYPTNQPIMMAMAPMPFPSPQAAQYYIPQYRHSTPYVGPPQQYSVQPPGTGTFYPGPGPGEYPAPYPGPSYYQGHTVYPPSPPIIVPTPQQPPPAKREKKTIRIRDPNQGGRDITEEIMAGGSGSRNSTPPVGRPSSTPTPPQVCLPDTLGRSGSSCGGEALRAAHRRDGTPKLEPLVQKSSLPALVQPEAPVERLEAKAPVAELSSPVEPELPSPASMLAPVTLPSPAANHSERPSARESTASASPPSSAVEEHKPSLAPPQTPSTDQPLSDAPPSPAASPAPPPKALNGLADCGTELDALAPEPSLQSSAALQPQASAPAPLEAASSEALASDVRPESPVAAALAPNAPVAVVPVTLTSSAAAASPAALPLGLPPLVQATTQVDEPSKSSDTKDLDEPGPVEQPAGDRDLQSATASSPGPLPSVLSSPPAPASSPEGDGEPAAVPEENGEADVEPMRNGAGHTSETESSDSGVTPGEKENSTEAPGKRQYNRDFLLGFQFMPACVQKPEGLPPISDVVLDKINQNKLPPRVVDTRAISRGPDFTPAFADFGRQMTGGRGATMMNMGTRRPPPRKIIMNVSVNEIQLKKSENAWKPGMKRPEVQADDPEVQNTQELFKKVRSILNKLTPQKFNQLMKQVTDLTIDTEERLKGVIDLVFEKAIDEPSFSVAYGNMCRCLATLKVPMTDKPNTTVNFRKLLLNRCQKEFEKDKVDDVVFERKQKELDSAASADGIKLQKLEEAKDKARRRSIGNIRFIGELFKLKMLTEAIMHDCVVKLLKNHDEESLECLCRLLTTIGKDLDFEKAKPRMDQYFHQMEKIVKERKVSSRIRFMLQDIMDLRLHNWVSRRADQGPKTIEQIHKEAKIEEQEEQRKVQQQLLSKDSKRREQRVQREETWNTVPVTKNSRTIDPTKIPKISKPQMDEKIQLGPRAQVTWGKGSSGGAKASDSGKNSLTDPTQRDGTLQELGPEMVFITQRSISCITRCGFPACAHSRQTLMSSLFFTPTVKPESVVQTPERPPLSVEETERKSKSIIDEFLHINDSKEAVQCVSELDLGSQLHVFVRVGVESTLERSQITRDHMGQLLFLLVQQGILPKPQFYKGFADTLELADDMAIDIPHIWLYLAELLAPVLKEEAFSMRELFSELGKPLLPVGRAGILISEILHILCKRTSHRTVASLWRESALSWDDFLPEDEDVEAFISEQKLQFLSDGPEGDVSKRILSPEELSQQLERLLLEDMVSDEEIFKWAEATVDESQTSSSPFLRALMTAVCKAAVKGKLDTAIIQKRLPVLLKYLNSDTERQLQALYALQALIVALDQPPNLLRMFFDCLYDEDVISEDAFYKWETSKDPAEQQGKGVALKSVTAFFTWLREAEEESEDN